MLRSLQRFPGGSVVQKPPANAGDIGSVPEWGRSPGREMAMYSSVLAWEIPWTEEPDGLQSMKLQKSQTRLRDSTPKTADSQCTWTPVPETYLDPFFQTLPDIQGASDIQEDQVKTLFCLCLLQSWKQKQRPRVSSRHGGLVPR